MESNIEDDDDDGMSLEDMLSSLDEVSSGENKMPETQENQQWETFKVSPSPADSDLLPLKPSNPLFDMVAELKKVTREHGLAVYKFAQRLIWYLDNPPSEAFIVDKRIEPLTLPTTGYFINIVQPNTSTTIVAELSRILEDESIVALIRFRNGSRTLPNGVQLLEVYRMMTFWKLVDTQEKAYQAALAYRAPIFTENETGWVYPVFDNPDGSLTEDKFYRANANALGLI